MGGCPPQPDHQPSRHPATQTPPRHIQCNESKHHPETRPPKPPGREGYFSSRSLDNHRPSPPTKSTAGPTQTAQPAPNSGGPRPPNRLAARHPGERKLKPEQKTPALPGETNQCTKSGSPARPPTKRPKQNNTTPTGEPREGEPRGSHQALCLGRGPELPQGESSLPPLSGQGNPSAMACAGCPK